VIGMIGSLRVMPRWGKRGHRCFELVLRLAFGIGRGMRQAHGWFRESHTQEHT
jgi:hypothetical protein